jgi:hypothetical protein
MQFRVPQNIQMEDKIIGPLTVIQFGICILGGGPAFLIITSPVIPVPINYFAGITLALITAFFALGKFNDQPMYRFFKFALAFIFRPKVRVWHKTGADIPLIKASEHLEVRAKTRNAKVYTRADIEKVAAIIDTRGTAIQKAVIHPAPPRQKP